MTQGKKIVITGASRGLGLALVEGFIEQGHTVFGCARSSRSVADLAKRFGPPHHFAVVDVADDAAVAAWAGQILKMAGPPDFLLNNAAVMNRNAKLWQVPPDEFHQMLDVNIAGVYHVLRHFVPAMVACSSGVIVNFSSTWGRTTSPEVAPYCATKWAIEGLTRALADELPAGMAAVPLNPGIIHTEMLESCFGKSGAESFPSPESWAKRAVPYVLQLGPKQNGKSLAVPGEGRVANSA